MIALLIQSLGKIAEKKANGVACSMIENLCVGLLILCGHSLAA